MLHIYFGLIPKRIEIRYPALHLGDHKCLTSCPDCLSDCASTTFLAVSLSDQGFRVGVGDIVLECCCTSVFPVRERERGREREESEGRGTHC